MGPKESPPKGFLCPAWVLVEICPGRSEGYWHWPRTSLKLIRPPSPYTNDLKEVAPNFSGSTSWPFCKKQYNGSPVWARCPLTATHKLYEGLLPTQSHFCAHKSPGTHREKKGSSLQWSFSCALLSLCTHLLLHKVHPQTLSSSTKWGLGLSPVENLVLLQPQF